MISFLEMQKKKEEEQSELCTYPLKAVTRSGMVKVCRGSTMPKRGLKARFPIPVFA